MMTGNSNSNSSFCEFTAVILASSVGTRLFPLTSLRHPKHLLPIVGVPLLHRLLRVIQSTGFTECVVAISAEDAVTIPSLQQLVGGPKEEETTEFPMEDPLASAEQRNVPVSFQLQSCQITVVRLHEPCAGSGDALRQIEATQLSEQRLGGSRPCVHPSSHVVLFPGDLVVLDDQPLKTLIHQHRQGNSGLNNQHPKAACTILLTDVCEMDENGMPLKESAKQKKGGLAREEEEIEYVALSYDRLQTSGPRLISKQPKMDVEEDVHMTGASPKFVLPRQRLTGGRVQVGLDWNDVHVYVLSPWIRQLLQARASTVVSLQEDLLPLLISRQYKGIAATFGSALKPEDRDRTETLLRLLKQPSQKRQPLSLTSAGDDNGAMHDPEGGVHDSSHSEDSSLLLSQEYAVRATVTASSVFRSHSVPSYLYANRECLNASLQHHASGRQFLDLAPQTETNAKFQSVVLPGSTIGDKVTFKSTVVGRGCKIGSKCRLNNVVLIEDVEIGENTILQNTVVASQVRIAENCNLNDCQVGPGHIMPAGTKAKVESFTAVDADDGFYN
ncbi:translation initiation factor eIF-2B subunit gamma [Fistulifera solaris]|uniref:Translation initiation factor eIF2B subunit gamma n=1 Tax=Fistulifera solaris TaxID=1519565 RepID=A0A1Z5JXP9_FISSO|nr:translation initiation factor eIF-2B subunit gamma [Fistulifera solaris]|eukprot:GAX18689.1 translation initiation factor eIF-2B subunit gamma [Fistulifera solaris]